MTSKKKLLLFKQHYQKNEPGILFDKLNFELPVKERSFDEVLQYLIDQKYLSLTKDGFYHLLPKGIFLQDAIEQAAKQLLESDRALRYRFSALFSSQKNDKIQSLISRFKQDIYNICSEGHKELYLKYASDPLLLEYFSNRELVLPHKTYSPDYFYRVIQSGELKPLIQPREFFMTDFHNFCELEDFDSFIDAALLNKRAVELFTNSHEWYLNIDTNLEYFTSHKDLFIKMLDKISVNAVINITSERTHYYSVQNQYIIDYYFGNTTQLANLQFDQKNGEHFAIISSSTKKPVSIIHGTIFGRSEKIIATVFGKQLELFQKNGHKPVLPLWLSPIIIRIIPLKVDGALKNYISKIEKELQKLSCRYDVDLREISLDKKIKTAERNWIPFQLIVGEKETSSNQVSIRDRYENKVYTLEFPKFILMIKEKIRSTINSLPQTTPSIFKGDEIY